MLKEPPTYRLTVKSALSACKLLVRLDHSGIGGPEYISPEDRRALERFGEGRDFSTSVSVDVKVGRNLSLKRFAHQLDTELWLRGVCDVEPPEESLA
ncbi:hypothetical protein EPO04_01920 [Patescibacteria group bacterium]|nr:MAG: hypothetical protein EPO04_01920 [Patescibacteria group bacterium]